MNIFDVLNFCRLNQLDEGAVTINDIRRGMLGKGHKYRISKNSRRWYDKNKNDLLDLLSDIVKSDNKMVKQKMQKFDTDPYFELDDDNKRALKADKFMNAVEYAFSSNIVADEHSKNKSTGLSDQYEKIVLDNGVEIYAVYTPTANIQLAHSILHTPDDPTPSWCIASPSSAYNMWNCYNLYDAEAPCVFIVYKKGERDKYELKADPYKSLDFKNKKIRLIQFIDEWRNPSQNESSINDTSLFDVMNISINTLENAIRHLTNTKKAEAFSAKYGKSVNESMEGMYDFTRKERILALTRLARNGRLDDYSFYIEPGEYEYFLNELIRYNTLTEDYLGMIKDDHLLMERAVNYLVKEKRAGLNCLMYARKQSFDEFKEMIHKVVPEIYQHLPNYFKDDEENEVIYKAAVSSKMINGDYITELYRNNKDFFMRHIDEMINIARKDKTIDGMFITVLIKAKLDINERNMFELCKIALGSHKNLRLMFENIRGGRYMVLIDSLVDLYCKSEKMNINDITSLSKYQYAKCLRKLIERKKYSWWMLANNNGLSSVIKNKIIKDIIYYTELGYLAVDDSVIEGLADTPYIETVIDTYIATGGKPLELKTFLFILNSDCYKDQTNLIKLVNSMNYVGIPYIAYTEKVLQSYSKNPQIITLYIKNFLKANSDDLDACARVAKLISADEFKGTELYKMGINYLKSSKKTINPAEVLNTVLKFIDDASQRVVNVISRGWLPEDVLIFTVLYHDINAAFDPGLEFISDPVTILQDLDEDDMLKSNWDKIIKKLHEVNFPLYDIDSLDKRCRNAMTGANNVIPYTFENLAKTLDLGVKISTDDKLEFLCSDSYYDFNPYLKYCAKIAQKLNKIVNRNQEFGPEQI